MMAAADLQTTCCIVGGGPAGVMLGVLLARAGVDVTVLEKYPDFFRDFRGDTIHPSTLQLLHELGWLDDFLKIPHNEMRTVGANVAGELMTVADFSHLPTHCKFIAFMPQWDFLKFLADRGRTYPGFHMLMKTEGTSLIEHDGVVTGVRAKNKDGAFDIHADLVVGTDGRHSTICAAAGFEVENLGAPMDVLWMRVDKEPGDPVQPLGTLSGGRLLIMIDREKYWQCAFIIPKGSFEQLKASGIQTLRDEIAEAVPVLRERTKTIEDWSKVSLLEVRVDRLNQWHRPGVLCIGDAAHAMSPIGGVGINLAVQDAVASANILANPLLERAADDRALARVQARRMFPTKVTQGMQLFIQEKAIEPLLEGAQIDKPPLPFVLFDHLPYLRRLPAMLIGLGIRPEHIRTPEVSP
jgi:2-polyprenyl-6-methoxyphenol hydroxylase-like FAD-dependent oxidoreductase